MKNTKNGIGREIYLDNAATTKVDPEVAKEVNRIFLENYGNVSSQHSIGRKARDELGKARKKIADYVGCLSKEIVFTSGGTESNNLALRGLAKANPEKKHIVTSAIEHPCILETCRELENEGFEIDYVSIDSDGIVDVEEIGKLIRDDTLVVSVMHVNNEIGTVQPIEEIGKICKKKKVYFHSDAVQGFGKLKIDISNVDLMSVSGHKIHAPKGVGFLYVKDGVKLSAISTGGGQEFGIRSGTENLPGIVGLAAALDVDSEEDKVRKIRDRIIDELLKIPGTRLNGSRENRVWNNINVSFYGIEGESLMLMLDKDGIYVSTGSACASTKLSESYVLKAIGVEELYIHGSLRLTLGEINKKDAEFVVERIKEKVERLREISPFKFEEVKNEKYN